MQPQQKRQPKSRNSRRGVSVLLMVLLSAGSYGCSDAPKAKAPIASVTSKQTISTAPTDTVPVLVEQKQAEVYSYIPRGRRDPFAPIIERETKKARSGDTPPLERFNIGEFKLTGIVWGGFGYNAVMEGPDGKGYFVRTGTVIGMNRGIVKKITSDRMVIEEKYKTYTGQVERKEIIVELRRKKEDTR